MYGYTWELVYNKLKPEICGKGWQSVSKFIPNILSDSNKNFWTLTFWDFYIISNTIDMDFFSSILIFDFFF